MSLNNSLNAFIVPCLVKKFTYIFGKTSVVWHTDFTVPELDVSIFLNFRRFDSDSSENITFHMFLKMLKIQKKRKLFLFWCFCCLSDIFDFLLICSQNCIFKYKLICLYFFYSINDKLDVSGKHHILTPLTWALA